MIPATKCRPKFEVVIYALQTNFYCSLKVHVSIVDTALNSNLDVFCCLHQTLSLKI